MVVKLLTYIKRKEGTTQEQFSKYWWDHHGPLVARTMPGMLRYVQNHPIRLPGGGEPKFDGITEQWFPDLDAFRKASELYLSDKGKVIRDDEERFIERNKMVFFVAEERVIINGAPKSPS